MDYAFQVAYVKFCHMRTVAHEFCDVSKSMQIKNAEKQNSSQNALFYKSSVANAIPDKMKSTRNMQLKPATHKTNSHYIWTELRKLLLFQWGFEHTV